MRKLTLILLLISFLSKAQEATIHFTIVNKPEAKNIHISNGDQTNADVLFGERFTDVSLTEGKGRWVTKLSKPIFVTAYFRDKSPDKSFRYTFYLTPGDALDFTFDANTSTYTVKGKGSGNNQPLIQKLFNNTLDLSAYEKDSLPNNIFKAVKKRNVENKSILEEYILKHQPTSVFKDIGELYIQYFPLWTYIRFKGDQKFNISRDIFTRNEHKWQAVEDSLTQTNSVNNERVLSIPYYSYFLGSYLNRIKERLWQHPELLNEYYEADNQEEVLKIFKKDPQNILQEKIINKHFKGKTAEFLYGILFEEALGEKEDNLPEIFSRFKQKYPRSEYISYIEPEVRKIDERRNRQLTEDMVVVENVDSYKTFDDVLKLIKGKTVLLDMWGTWCGPCRSEISKNSESIKSHFKGKGLDYLYVANFDMDKADKWKALIPYYNLTGTHILASAQLTKDIMEKVKGKGYPTYVIIKKDGSFELSKAGYPMNRSILIEQLEHALKE